MKKLLSTLTAVALLLPQLAMADNQYTLGDVYDLPVMYLGRGLSSGAQTNNIFTVPVIRNNEEVTPPAMSGAVFELSRGGLTEKVFATRVTVNTSTNVLTLTGTVIRDLCFTAAREFATCGNGVTWQKGTEVRLVTHARQLNSFVNKDRANVLTASGGLTFTGSGSLGFPTFATEAERNRSLGSTPSGPVRVGCVTATGKCEYYIGGAWIGFGSGGTVNASTTARGVVQMAAVSNLSGGTVTGTSGAPLVVGTDLVIRNSTGAVNNRNKVAATNNAGYLSGSLLGGNCNSTSKRFLRNDQACIGGTSSQVLYGSGSFAAVRQSEIEFRQEDVRIADTANVGASSTVRTNVGSGVVLTGSTLANRNVLHLVAAYDARDQAGNGTGQLIIGPDNGTKTVLIDFTINNPGNLVLFDLYLTFRDTDATGVIEMTGIHKDDTALQYHSTNFTGIDFTQNLRLQARCKFTASDANNWCREESFIPMIFRQ